jgi:hypothetical protein
VQARSSALQSSALYFRDSLLRYRRWLANIPLDSHSVLTWGPPCSVVDSNYAIKDEQHFPNRIHDFSGLPEKMPGNIDGFSRLHDDQPDNVDHLSALRRNAPSA